jgi:hypothetical protein
LTVKIKIKNEIRYFDMNVKNSNRPLAFGY